MKLRIRCISRFHPPLRDKKKKRIRRWIRDPRVDAIRKRLLGVKDSISLAELDQLTRDYPHY